MLRVALATLLIPAGVLGSTLTPMPLLARVSAADRVVLAQVVSIRTELRHGDVRKMLTHTEVVVGDTLKGPPLRPGADRITVTQLGGKQGLWEAHIPGDATFTVGETVLLLLRCSPTPDRCGLVSLNEGKIPVVGSDAFVFDSSTGQYTKRSVSELMRSLRSSSSPARPAATGVTP